MQQQLVQLLDLINEPLTYVLLVLLVICALLYTVRTRGVQFRLLGEMFRVSFERPKSAQPADGGKRAISPIEAFLVGLASRIGTGNMAGVATAIAIGGPGSIFWMWMMALVGSANSFVECTLAQLYKIRGKDSFIGGPAYYISRGMKKHWFAQIFAVAIVLDFGFTNNLVQSNTISLAFTHAFGINPWVMAVVLTGLSLAIIFGGIQRIARVSSVVVPFMAVMYLGLAVFVVAINWREIPSVLWLIVDSAFGGRQAMGGMVGTAIIMGLKRGLFSNEAGEGSAPNAAATAETSHPVKQGLIQTLGVYMDTLVVCTCTALIILCSGVWNGGESGIELTQLALTEHIGPVGGVVVAVAIFFFAFSSILGNYFYGETNVYFLSKRPGVMLGYRLLLGVMVFVGALTTLDVAWGLVDLFMAIMTICNVIALFCLGKYALRLLDDYMRQR
ncbi:MAG: alanine/glycine:cation symporter family protein, partial [Bacteroidales bacterium]|nr:alanine/glycine:cation symporter family protein [Bacteroidales bacterium]